MFALGHFRPGRAEQQVQPCPLCLQERPFKASVQIVAKCQKATFALAANCDLFNHLVGATRKRQWNRKPQSLSRLEVDNEF